MTEPAWERAIRERTEALQKLRSARQDFRQAIVSRYGLVFIRWDNTSLRFSECRCGPNPTNVETAAMLLAVAGFGDPKEFESYLKYCTVLGVKYVDAKVQIRVYSQYTPPVE